MKRTVRLVRPIGDINIGGDMYEHIIANKTSTALTQRHLPRYDNSPLKEILLRTLKTAPKIRLFLNVAIEEDNNIIKQIGIGWIIEDSVDRDADMMRRKLDYDAVDNCIREYFKSVGFPDTVCTSNADILHFIEQLQRDIPIINEYIIIEDED